MRNLTIIFLCAALSCPSITAWAQTDKAPQLIQGDEFSNPGVEYRPIAFYSLNDRIDPQVVKRHVREFREGGFGGTFFHARIGLITDYLEKSWWDAVDAGVETCEKEGVKAWFYDEDKWPSGYAGGKVPLANREFVSQCIVRVKKGDKIEPGTKVLFEDENYSYVVNYEQWGQFRFNGTSYVDLLNPATVKAFIDTTYVAYHDRYKDKLGTTAMGVFTDEPQIRPRPSIPAKDGTLTYSPHFFETFRELNGYDLTSVLPLLFEKGEGYEKVRSDYFRTIAHMYERSFAKQIGDYCASNELIFTGHYLHEETTLGVALNGGNTMPMYRHMQMPGIDQLELRYLPLFTPKAMSSVANQYGRLRRLSEAFGISGQNMNFEDRKWILDWHSLFGINFITPHLTLYSLRGERKRDYPPTFGAYQPYWKYNKIYEDYSARMSYAASVGKYAADIAVMNPIESAWIEADNITKAMSNERTDYFAALLEKMQATHRDWDILDEQIASEIAKAGKNGITVGEMTYRVVIVPAMLTIRQSTIDLLGQFAAQGGKVLVAREYPTYVDAVKNPAAIEKLKGFSQMLDESAMEQVLAKALAPKFTITLDDPAQVWTQLREVPGGKLIQLTNTSRKNEAACCLRFADKQQQVAIWDPISGKSFAFAPAKDGTYDINFSQTQTWIVTTGTVSAQADLKTKFAPRTPNKQTVVTLDGEWKGRRVDPNVITLDFARWSQDGGVTYSEPEPVLGIFTRLRNKVWDGELTLKYEVAASYSPQNCKLVVESPQMYKSVTLNGKSVTFGSDFYLDDAFKKGDVGGMLQRGKNEIVLKLDFTAPRVSSLDPAERMGSEIEAVYLLGDFGVKADKSATPLATSEKNERGYLIEKPIMSYNSFEITPEAEKFNVGTLTDAGYPFYAGSFVLEKQFTLDKIDPKSRYFVTLPLFEAIVVNIEVNGKATQPIVFHPHEADITDFIRNGGNSIKITLTNSLRNTLGPHHHVGGELASVGPGSFTGASTWTSTMKGERNWFDLRAEGTKTGIWRDDYYMVPFGLLASPLIVMR